MTNDFSDKVMIISGASSGIGRAVAQDSSPASARNWC